MLGGISRVGIGREFAENPNGALLIATPIQDDGHENSSRHGFFTGRFNQLGDNLGLLRDFLSFAGD
jgi:hypothetical protein